MKNKLQALIAEQKALTAKFEELVNENTEESSTLDPKKVYIKGHLTRSDEVIKMLEDLGGVNISNFCGNSTDRGYYIVGEYIFTADLQDLDSFTELHLPEEVSAENLQTADIKVGEFEEVELVEGEVYWARDFAFIYIGQNDDDSCRYLCGVNTFCDSVETKLSNSGSFIDKEHNELATPEQRKQLFDALEKAGKHFDKDNMRLLDVEEWSCDKGHPVIARILSSSNWEVEIFTDYDILMYDFGFAIPYNDQTKRLIGTTDSPDKHYKFVEL